MSKFTDTVHNDTPRLVVMFRRDGDNEMFQWGMVGAMPLLTLVGAIVRFQGEAGSWIIDEQDDHYCNESALCLAWDVAHRRFVWFVHPDVPVDSLVGMLETIKAALVGTHMARQAAAQQVRLLGPDGQPMRG